MSGARILVVDDEPGVRSSLEGVLGDEGFDVRSVESGEAALDEAGRGAFDAVLLDVWLPGIDGLATLQGLRERQVDAEVVMISGHGTIETAVRATKLGAFDFVEKPLSLEKTLLVVRNALRTRRLERRNLALLEQLARDTEIVGGSPAVEALRRQVDAAAHANGAVLVVGERGSGRQTVVRRIHALGRRASAAFVEVPCAALDAAAAAAALFGDGGSPGRLGLAAGGTLFLDGVDRLDLDLQDRLAAQLATTELIEGGARVVASAVGGGQPLTEALRRRVEWMLIRVPSLRERRDDVLPLAEHFMNALAREYGREAKRWSPRALEALTAHDWPGNVRELRHLVEQLLLTVEGPVLELADLPEPLGTSRSPAVDLYAEFETLAQGVAAFERYHVARALDREARDVERASRRLGVTPDALRNRLAQLGL
jgi:two-component system nitrogen regulation response regulator NtrX